MGYTPEAAEELITEFVEVIAPKFINEMSDDDFAKFQSALKKKKEEKFPSMAKEAQFYWGEIVDNQFEFERKQIEAPIVEKLTKADVIEYMKHFGKDRKRISIHLQGHPKPDAELKQPKRE